jgi:hypothetical protein
MTLQVNIPDSLLRQTAELAERQQVTVDQVVTAALTAQVSAAYAPQHRGASPARELAESGRNPLARSRQSAGSRRQTLAMVESVEIKLPTNEVNTAWQSKHEDERIVAELLACLGISQDSFVEAVAWSLCEHLVTFLAQDRPFLLRIRNDRDFLVQFGNYVNRKTGRKWAMHDLMALKTRLFMAFDSHERQPVRYEEWLRLLFTKPLKCAKCGAVPPQAKLEIDHIFPSSRGGSSRSENLRFLCQKHKSSGRATSRSTRLS